jgi:hypothetical protein
MRFRQAMTRGPSIVAILVLGIATVAGLWYYFQSDPEPTSAPFSMTVISRPRIPMTGDAEVPMAMVGQRVMFLVVVDDTGEGTGYGHAVNISAMAAGARVAVNHPLIQPGHVAEVTVIPNPTSTHQILTLTITGERRGFTHTEAVDLAVIDWDDELGAVATEMRDMFVPWLASNHPELGITNETEWLGTIVNPGILVVMHYLFYSDEWELYVTWHVMIPPYDWTRIYLRSRFTETHSSLAFEISSVQGDEEPHAIELPDWV